MDSGQLVVVLAQTAASWAMAGFITTLQVLNYPLLALIDPAGVPRYETAHNRRFAVVLAPGLLGRRHDARPVLPAFAPVVLVGTGDPLYFTSKRTYHVRCLHRG